MARFTRLVLIAVALVITLLDFFGLQDFANSPYHGIRDINLVFLKYFDDSPAKGSGLRPGDRIDAVDGVPVRNIIHFKYLTYSNLEYKPQTYTIAREGEYFNTKVEYTGQPQRRVYEKISYSFVAFTFIFVGLYVILKRNDILGRLFSINCINFSFLLTERPAVSAPILHVIGELFYDCLFAFLPAVFLHFFLIFPGKDIHRGSRRSMLTKALYLPPSLIFISFFILALMNYSSEIDPSVLLLSNSIASIYWVLYMIGGITMFIRTYSIADSVQKIKFRIATVGVAVGIIPVTFAIVLPQFLPSFDLPMEPLYMLCLSFVSVSFAYAILKHDAFDMRRAFRAGLAYVIPPVFLVGIFYFSAKALAQKFTDLPGGGHYPTILAAVLLALVAFFFVKAEIQNFVDRLFLKDRKVFRAKVLDFSRRIQFLGTIEEISGFAVSELKDLLKSESTHIFLKDGNKKFIHGQSDPREMHIPLTEFPDGIEIINISEKKRRPIMVEYYDRLWINNNLDRISIELVSLLHVSVIVPLVEQNEMLGFILLGKKSSGKPYNRTDAEILELVGERCSAAIRRSVLFEASVEKEKLEKEVHLASEIQKRLLPEKPPFLCNTSISGRLLNSMDVGGDFYDFVEFSKDVVGIAVADVSGKGIPASLLMTTLQASFRSEATLEKSPAEVIVALNKSLFSRSELSKFATFFYAKYDDSSGLLRYSNGGSFPPLLVRHTGKIEYLKRGGILVGVVPDAHYNEGAVMLLPGDLLMIYTDGVIDQENSKEDYFGEERLRSFLKVNIALGTDQIMEKLYEAVRIFGEGCFKDDITAVILKRSEKAVSRVSAG